MWAAVSPSSTGPRCVFLEISGQRAGSVQRGAWLPLPSSRLVCAAGTWAGSVFQGCVKGCLSGRAARPLRSGVMAETLSLCCSFVLPWLDCTDLCSGLSWAEETCRDLAESLHEWEPDLSQDSALPLLYSKITWPFCDLGFVLGEGVIAFIMRPVD